jgi:hypothetical protein
MDQFGPLLNALLNMGSAAAPFAVYLLMQNNKLQARYDKAMDDRIAQIKESNDIIAKMTEALKELTNQIRRPVP